MAKASHTHFGPAHQGKGDGTGAMTEVDTAAIPDNIVLSNRDKALHSEARGMDGKAILTEQRRDHAANRRDADIDETGLVDVRLPEDGIDVDEAAENDAQLSRD